MKLRLTLVLLAFLYPVQLFAANLTIAVAANVQFAFQELETAFEKKTDIEIDGVIGSSGKFVAQIENGAPFDIFLSADTDYPKALQAKGLTCTPPQIYSYGYLVLWTMNDLDVSKGISVLTKPDIRKIAIASPKTAPYGLQAINAMKFYKLYPAIENKIVYGENIAQTNQFITTKAADIGITAKSTVLAPNMKDRGKWVDLDQKSYNPIAQGMVILKHAQSHNLQAAEEFFNFILSEEARVIFMKYGYRTP